MDKFYSLKPTFVTKVWGGEKLYKLKGLNIVEGEPLGETWEVSRHKDGPSFDDQGRPLTEVYSQEQLPYLVKFIDTTDYLSVQVHPDDEYASTFEKSVGKTECWLILATENDAGIFLGLKKGVSRDTLQKAIEKKEDLSKFLNFYPVEVGDFFFVPAGTIHAIGKGVTLVEIQQSSGITYRVWDWNRLGLDGKPRELHIDKALDVINFSLEKNDENFFKIKRGILSNRELVELIDHEDFNVQLVSLSESQKIKLKASKRVRSLITLDKALEINGKVLPAYSSMVFGPEFEKEFAINLSQSGGELSQSTHYLFVQ